MYVAILKHLFNNPFIVLLPKYLFCPCKCPCKMHWFVYKMCYLNKLTPWTPSAQHHHDPSSVFTHAFTSTMLNPIWVKQLCLGLTTDCAPNISCSFPDSWNLIFCIEIFGSDEVQHVCHEPGEDYRSKADSTESSAARALEGIGVMTFIDGRMNTAVCGHKILADKVTPGFWELGRGEIIMTTMKGEYFGSKAHCKKTGHRF